MESKEMSENNNTYYTKIVSFTYWIICYILKYMDL